MNLSKWLRGAVAEILKQIEAASYVDSPERVVCRYPVRVWVDSANGGKQRMDTWNGTNILITEPGMEVEVSPHVDHLKCLLFETEQEEPAIRTTPATVHQALQLHGVRRTRIRWTVKSRAKTQSSVCDTIWMSADAFFVKKTLMTRRHQCCRGCHRICCERTR